MGKKIEYEGEKAVCTECHSDQPIQSLIRNPFFQQGGEIPCKFCGGIVIIVKSEERTKALRRRDQRRGSGSQEED